MDGIDGMEQKDPHNWPQSDEKVIASEQTLTAIRCRFGERLRQAREARGISVTGLAQSTRISIPFIEALEAGSLDKLPGEVFGRGFVRNLCRALGADAESFVAEFAECYESTETKSAKVAPKGGLINSQDIDLSGQPNITRSSSNRRRSGRYWRPALGLVAIVLVGGVLVVWKHGGHKLNWVSLKSGSAALSESLTDADKAPTSVNSVHAGANAAAGASSKTSASAPVTLQNSTGKGGASAAARAPVRPKTAKTDAQPKDQGAPVKLAAASNPVNVQNAVSGEARSGAQGKNQVLDFVVTEPVRVRFGMDRGETVTRELQPNNYRFTFSDKADLLIFDASAVKISFNGRALGSLGGKGRVRRLSFAAAVPQNEKNAKDAKNEP